MRRTEPDRSFVIAAHPHAPAAQTVIARQLVEKGEEGRGFDPEGRDAHQAGDRNVGIARLFERGEAEKSGVRIEFCETNDGTPVAPHVARAFERQSSSSGVRSDARRVPTRGAASHETEPDARRALTARSDPSARRTDPTHQHTNTPL